MRHKEARLLCYQEDHSVEAVLPGCSNLQAVDFEAAALPHGKTVGVAFCGILRNRVDGQELQQSSLLLFFPTTYCREETAYIDYSLFSALSYSSSCFIAHNLSRVGIHSRDV